MLASNQVWELNPLQDARELIVVFDVRSRVLAAEIHLPRVVERPNGRLLHDIMVIADLNVERDNINGMLSTLSGTVVSAQQLLIKTLRLSPFNRRNLDLHALFTFPG